MELVIDLLDSLGLFILALSLLAVSLYRHYPVRSVMVYTSITALALISVIADIGGSIVAFGYDFDLDILRFGTNVLRGAGIVGLGALVLYEYKYSAPNRAADI